ncbi:alpha/beta hydrolase [Kribbella sp. NPDC056861]|uniref:alpha/beta fold hydrolase n=1 Tax=Kribbella sp. NPDC056861 TaxID=3154857 RepID=UPI003447F29E
MSELIVDGVKVSYHVAGSGPVCLVHSGGPGIHYDYLRMPELERHLTMVYLEPVGTGASDLLPDGDYSMEKYAYFADQVAQHLGEEKVFFLGHSHGGFVALQFALDYPDRLRGVIVYDGMAFNGQELGEEAFRQIEAYVARRPAGDPVAAQVLAAWQEETPEDKASQVDALQRLLPVYFKDFEEIAPRLADWFPLVDITIDPNRQPSAWDVRERLGEIAVPVLVIVGAYDFICGEKWARQLHDGIKGSELVVLGDSGHFGHLEEPEAFFGAVLRFAAAH